MNITAIASEAIKSSFDRFGAAASAVTNSTTSSDPVDTVDISSAVVELTEAKLQASASLKVLEAARDIDRLTLDIFA